MDQYGRALFTYKGAGSLPAGSGLRNRLIVHWPRTATQEIAPVNSPGATPRMPFVESWEGVSARNSPPDSDHLFQLDIGRATRRVTRWLSFDSGGASVELSRTCWRKHADRDAGFWNSFRGRRVTDRSGCWTDGDFATAIRLTARRARPDATNGQLPVGRRSTRDPRITLATSRLDRPPVGRLPTRRSTCLGASFVHSP
jgi:hypothetical protein